MLIEFLMELAEQIKNQTVFSPLKNRSGWIDGRGPIAHVTYANSEFNKFFFGSRILSFRLFEDDLNICVKLVNGEIFYEYHFNTILRDPDSIDKATMFLKRLVLK